MSDVKFETVMKSYGDHVAVRDVDLHVKPGEFMTLLGPSGCGKTTCLRMVAGFVVPTSGRVLMGGKDVTSLAPHKRNTGMVFQSYALFPHQTVAENVAFGLRVRRLPRAERETRTREALKLVHMDELAERYPGQLSGGQKQRVALARAVVIKPEVLLLDEPLAALDLKLREELQVEIKRVQSVLKITTLFVTHDQGEALSMSDRVAVMRDGRLLQVAPPGDLYERPSSCYVANFVGRTNLIEVAVVAKDSDRKYQLETRNGPKTRFTIEGAQHGDYAVGENCILAVRPENVRFGEAAAGALVGLVKGVTYRGSVWNVDLEGPAGETFTALVPPGEALPATESRVAMTWRPDRSFLLKAE